MRRIDMNRAGVITREMASLKLPQSVNCCAVIINCSARRL